MPFAFGRMMKAVSPGLSKTPAVLQTPLGGEALVEGADISRAVDNTRCSVLVGRDA